MPLAKREPGPEFRVVAETMAVGHVQRLGMCSARPTVPARRCSGWWLCPAAGTQVRSPMFRFMLLYASLGGAAATTLRLPAAVGCKADEDCSLNGICAPGGVCQCRPGWKGAACSFLDRRPAASESAAAVYGMHPM